MEKITTPRRAPFGSNPKVGETGRATQQRILTAAADAFAEVGYARTSVEAITDRADCSRPTFYQYFSGKEEIHRHLAARLGGELSQLLQRLDPVTADSTGRDVLFRWLLDLTAVHQRHRAVADNFTASLRTDDRMVAGAAELSAEYGRALVKAIDRSMTDSIEFGVDVGILAGAANATSFGACIFRDRIGDVSAERLAAALADVLHRTFFGPIPGVNLGPRIAASPSQPDGDVIESAERDDRPRRKRGVETRQRLVAAAATSFGALGYDAVRVDDIAAEAGTSHGTFYRYFSDKDAVFDEHADTTSTEVAALLADLPVEPGQELTWAARYAEHYRCRGGIIDCLRDARAAGVQGAIRARYRMAAALAAALDQRSFGDTDADVVTCFSLLENVPAATAYGYSGLTGEQATSVIAIMLGRGLFGHEHPPSPT
jgi:AcrR family transcriptional regulator